MSKDFLDSVARIQKADVGSQVPYGNNIAPQLQTSGTPLVSSSASGDNIPQENNVVNSTAHENNTKLTDKCTLIPTKHTQTGKDIWVITVNDRLSKDDYNDLSAKVKAVGGYYSRFAKTPDLIAHNELQLRNKNHTDFC